MITRWVTGAEGERSRGFNGTFACTGTAAGKPLYTRQDPPGHADGGPIREIVWQVFLTWARF